jgi:hypothetical protein
MALLIPFAGFLLVQLCRVPRPWQSKAAVAACVVLLTTATLDIGRAFNYPAMFPKDAIAAGWTIRHLQENGTVPESSKILIEKGMDLGDVGIVAIANRPERFVAINELIYRRLADEALPRRQIRGPALTVSADAGHGGVRGTACDAGFEVEVCKDSLVREQFRLVILSSPQRVSSFRDTFEAKSWNIGKYHIFDMNSSDGLNLDSEANRAGRNDKDTH